jgi:hypothetical protein
VGYIWRLQQGRCENWVNDSANISVNIEDSILTEGQRSKNIRSAMLVKSLSARVKLQDFSWRMSEVPQNEGSQRIACAQGIGMLV